MRVWSLGQEDPLEKEMATQSSILAWRILWIEETGGLTVCGVTKRQTRLKWLSSGKISDFIKLIQISKSFKCEKKKICQRMIEYIHRLCIFTGSLCTMYFLLWVMAKGVWKLFIFFDGKGDWGIHAVVEATRTHSVDSRLACSALGRLGRIGSCDLPLGQPHSIKAWGNPAHARAKH